jgi:hypothetical protein
VRGCSAIAQLEAEVLALPKDSQVILLARLLERLGQNSEIDPKNTASWAEEAEKRDETMTALASKRATESRTHAASAPAVKIL